MQLLRRLVPLGVLALMPACGSDTLEPGTIVITLGTTPAVTNDPTVQITGQATRTPAASRAIIVVTATKGGQAVADTADPNGAFLLTVTLTTNMENRIQINASDNAGSTAATSTVVVVHDDQPPRVASSTPANQADGVVANSISLVFDEPVVLGSVAVSVSQQGAAVAGTAALSPDGLTLTFTPSAPFVINAIHDLTVSGARDSLGNTQVAPTTQCFVTGGSGIFSVADPAGDLYQTPAPPSFLVPPDLLQIRLARAGGRIHTILLFDAPRSLSDAGTIVAVSLDFDVDADSATGFVSVKDFIFEGLLPHSGIGAEYAMWILPQDTPTDSSFTIQYTSILDGFETFRFVQSLCGPLLGVVVPEAALGGDIGSARFVGYAEALAPVSDTLQGYVDPAPDVGYYSAVLAAGTARGAPAVFAPARAWSSFPRPFSLGRRLSPLRRQVR